MPQDEFDRHKEALIVKKLEKPKTIFQQFSVFYGEIAMQTYHFDREEAEVAILRKITKADFVEYFKVRISMQQESSNHILIPTRILIIEIHNKRWRRTKSFVCSHCLDIEECKW